MDLTSLTDADLARLALSTRLRELSDEFRRAVAAEDGDGPAGTDTADGAPAATPRLATRLWSLLATEVPLLQEAIVHQVRSTGGSWADVAACCGVDEDEARKRWQHVEVTRTADPVAAAAALDAWYVRHAQLEPLAHVRDPFSRLLSPNTPGERECLICVKYQGGAMPAYGGHVPPPGGYLVDDGMWRVGHGPTPYWPAGTLLIESYRHFLDFAELNEAEAASIGPLIRRFVGPIREAMDAPRVHVFSCMEAAEHFHVWLVPRTGTVSSGRGFIADPGYCTAPEAEAAVSRIRAALDRAEADR